MQLILETERFRLVSTDVGLAPVVLDYWQRNRVFMRPWVRDRLDSFYELDTQRRLLTDKLFMQLEGRLLHFLIFSKKDTENNLLLGQVGCSNIIHGPLQSCFVGYSVDEAANGKGVATEALRAVLLHAFIVLKLHRVEANIMPSNLASLRVVEKLGFRGEGLSKAYLKINGNWEDHLRLAILREEFLNPAKP